MQLSAFYIKFILCKYDYVNSSYNIYSKKAIDILHKVVFFVTAQPLAKLLLFFFTLYFACILFLYLIIWISSHLRHNH